MVATDLSDNVVCIDPERAISLYDGGGTGPIEPLDNESTSNLRGYVLIDAEH